MNNLENIGDEEQLYEYIIDLAQSSDESEYKKIKTIEKYLNHSSSEIRSAAFFSLLSILKFQNEELKTLAINNIMDKNEDEDLRVKCMSGLAQTYISTKDKKLLTLLFNILNDKSENKYIKSSAFTNLLILYGLNSREIFLRRGGYKQYINNEDFVEFSSELNNIKDIVDSNPPISSPKKNN